jgi:antitoxin (DNA-binding transcriptional repressor) of toxin-antitoxin stability system
MIIRFYMKTLTVTEAARNFSDFISRVHYRGERTLLLKGGRPMVEVIPARQAKTGGELAALWAKSYHLSPDEAEAFGHDLEDARRRLPLPQSPWDSSSTPPS